MRPLDNIKLTTHGDLLRIEIDLSRELGPSSSGKSMIVATTRGNVEIPGHPDPDLKLGLNLFKPRG